MKKIISLVLISLFLLSYTGIASENKPLEKIGKGLDEVVYGSVETPDNINATNSKGTKAFSDCTDKTKDGVGRAIVRVVGGVFKLATFWYPED